MTTNAHCTLGEWSLRMGIISPPTLRYVENTHGWPVFTTGLNWKVESFYGCSHSYQYMPLWQTGPPCLLCVYTSYWLVLLSLAGHKREEVQAIVMLPCVSKHREENNKHEMTENKTPPVLLCSGSFAEMWIVIHDSQLRNALCMY